MICIIWRSFYLIYCITASNYSYILMTIWWLPPFPNPLYFNLSVYFWFYSSMIYLDSSIILLITLSIFPYLSSKYYLNPSSFTLSLFSYFLHFLLLLHTIDPINYIYQSQMYTNILLDINQQLYSIYIGLWT